MQFNHACLLIKYGTMFIDDKVILDLTEWLACQT